MSGGAIVVAPALVMGAAALAAAAVIIGAAVAVALVVRAAQAGTVATGRALEQFGAEMERTAGAQDDLAVRTRLWELAAGAVVQTNKELCLLTARAQKAGVRLPLPPPFDLTGRGLADTRGWVVRTQEALALARTEVERVEAEREQRELLARMPIPADGSPTAAQTLAHYGQVLANRRKSAREHRPVEPMYAAEPTYTVDKDRIGAEIDQILARLDVDAVGAEREEAILTAARAAKQTDPGMTSTYLGRLARIVDERINPKVARRKESAVMLSALQHPVIAATISETAPRPPFLRSIERLQAIVLGDADLTDDDRREAMESLAWAEKAVERRQLLRAMTETFTKLGYQVTTGLQIHHTEALSVAGDGWHGGHSADVWIDDQGSVQFRMIELQKGVTGEATHCEQLNQAMGTVGEALAQRGFEARVSVPRSPMKPVRRWETDPVHAIDDSSTMDTISQKAMQITEEDDK